MFLPPAGAKEGATWEIAPPVAAKLLTHFYPPTENSDIGKNRIDAQRLFGTVETIRGGRARVRLAGELSMKHTFYHKPDDKFVRATVLGYTEVDVARRRIASFHLVTEQADYGGPTGNRLPFGVAVRLVS